MRLRINLPGPFSVSVGGGRRRRSSRSRPSPKPRPETKIEMHDRGIRAAMTLYTSRSYLAERDLDADEICEYGVGRSAKVHWKELIKHTGSHREGFLAAPPEPC
jgi:hypothetical protein